MKNNILYIVIIIAIILVIINLKQCNDSIESKAAVKQYERNIVALNDLVQKTVNKHGDTVFVETAVVGDIKDITKTEAFKSLSKEKQQFYLDLKRTKGLLASAQAEIERKDSLLQVIFYSENTTVTDSTVTFVKGDSLVFDTITPHLSYKAKITFNDKPQFEFHPAYNFNIQTSFIREKDKTITVEYKLDDPKASVLSGQSFIIPIEQKSKFMTFVDKYSKYVIPAATAVGGFYLGSKITVR